MSGRVSYTRRDDSLIWFDRPAPVTQRERNLELFKLTPPPRHLLPPPSKRQPVTRDLTPNAIAQAPVAAFTSGRYVHGYATTWNYQYLVENPIEGTFLEEVARGATLKTVSERGSRIKVQFNHGRDTAVGALPVARLVDLHEDELGLAYTAELLPGPHREQLAAALGSGQLGSSMSFRAIREDFSPRPGLSKSNPRGLPVRVLKEIAISELGPVVHPANSSATAGLRENVFAAANTARRHESSTERRYS